MCFDASLEQTTKIRHDPLYAGHPRLYSATPKEDVDGPDKPGHDV